MFLTIVQIVFLIALAVFVLTSDVVTNRISAVTVAITSVIWALALLVAVL